MAYDVLGKGMYVGMKAVKGEKEHEMASDFKAEFNNEESTNILFDQALIEQMRTDKGWIQFDAYLSFDPKEDKDGNNIGDMVRQIFDENNGKINMRFKPRYKKPE